MLESGQKKCQASEGGLAWAKGPDGSEELWWLGKVRDGDPEEGPVVVGQRHGGNNPGNVEGRHFIF